MLTECGLLAFVERDQDVGGGLHTGMECRLWHRAHRQRRPVAVALETHQPSGRFDGDFRRRFAR